LQQPVPHIIRNNTFWVSPERCLYWEEQNTLIVSDLHLGKSGHFRKAGIAVPQSVYKADMQRLIAQLYLFKADRLIIVGDLTHSTANKELDLFIKWRKDFSLLRIDLIKGNHDILDHDWYDHAQIHVNSWKMATPDFVFLHDLNANKRLTEEEKKLYPFTGHLHPGIGIRGKGKQHLTFPCFYFAKEYCVLPAFSRFTGTFNVNPGKEDTAFAIVDNSLVRFP
jgi:uncharacterized protein